jgi:hypothetical protein
MKKLRMNCLFGGMLLLIFAMSAQISLAQNLSNNLTVAQVPPLIQFSGVASDEGGNYLTGKLEISFSIYASEQGGEPLWSEVQTVQLDRGGHYAVQLGVTKPSGVPTTLFSAGQARWLGVQIIGQNEQPRVLLVSVPYAIKAGDAATIGGLPPSAFVLAGPSAVSGEAVSSFVSTGTSTTSSAEEQTAAPATAVTGEGTTDFIPLWTSGSVLGNSVLFQTGSGSAAKIGINTTTPSSTLAVNGAATIGGQLSLPAQGTATASSGVISHTLNLVASTFNSGTSKAVNQTFRWQAEPSGNDTASPAGTLNLLYGSGSSTPTETGLSISSKGQVTFAPGQILPAANVVGELGGASGNITGFSCNCLIGGSSAIFSGGVTAGSDSSFDNINASGTLTVGGNTNITGGITGGSIVTTGIGSFSSITETGDISSFGNISGSQASFENDSTFETLDLQNLATPAADVFVEAQFNNAGKAIVWTNALGDFNAIGTKSAVVPANDGSMVKLFAVESPQVWFDDYGSGQLSAGKSKVSLDAAFVQTVNTSTQYHVFLTPKGDCKGLYVTNESTTGFEVKELGGGTSSVAFDYRIVALRKGYEHVRLPVTSVPRPIIERAVRQAKHRR